MMKNLVTVTIPIRNRDALRIRNSVLSIRQGGADPTFNIIDYGSDKEYATQYQEVCKELNLNYTHIFTEGRPWSRSVPLNYGVSVSETPFVVTTDVDIIYQKNPIQWCLDNYSEKTFFNIPTYWLPQNGDRSRAEAAGTGSQGGYVFTNISAYKETNGYDERFVYWGQEDLDWSNRLKKVGYKQVWLPEDLCIYHVWHPKAEGKYFRPATATFDSIKIYFENEIQPVLKETNWGNVPLTKNERPIFYAMQNQTPAEYNVPYSSMAQHHRALYEFLQKNKFVHVNLMPRLRQKPFQKFKNVVRKVVTPACHATGLECDDDVNNNFDFLYPLIPTLQKLGLRDYFLNQDLSEIYMLWEK